MSYCIRPSGMYILLLITLDQQFMSFLQGVPVCVALSLTIIARRMAARHVLVKNLANIETLGCMSVLCSDKTGTLTEGNMVGLIPSSVL